jgi:hypothetical protein
MSANAATGLMRGKAIWHFVSLQYQQQSGGNSTTLVLSFFFLIKNNQNLQIVLPSGAQRMMLQLLNAMTSL